MGKNAYIGVLNVARRVKQPYIGVDNVARKVKNGFLGVDNVARQFYASSAIRSITFSTWNNAPASSRVTQLTAGYNANGEIELVCHAYHADDWDANRIHAYCSIQIDPSAWGKTATVSYTCPLNPNYADFTLSCVGDSGYLSVLDLGVTNGVATKTLTIPANTVSMVFELSNGKSGTRNVVGTIKSMTIGEETVV